MSGRVLRERELLDIPGAADREEIEGNLREIMLANRWFGGISVVLSHLSKFICPETGGTVRILDMATGSADIPMAIVRWAEKRGIDVRILGVDKNPDVVEIARRYTREFPQISIEKQDILRLSYPDGSFHLAICSQVLHHLTDDEVVTALRNANHLATDGILASDLRRSGLCKIVGAIASRLATNRLSRHDAAISFRNAFTPGELERLAEEAGLPVYKIVSHGPCRLALVVDKRTVECAREGVKRAAAIPTAV